MRFTPAALAALIVLHQPSGEIYVNPDEIMLVLPAAMRFSAPGMKSAVLVHDTWIYVFETPAQVKELRDGASGEK